MHLEHYLAQPMLWNIFRCEFNLDDSASKEKMQQFLPQQPYFPIILIETEIIQILR